MIATKGKSQSAAKKPQKTKAPTKKQRRKRTGVAFHPTQEQRNIVMLAAAMGYGHDRMRQLIINPHTGAPIGKNMLTQKFKSELANGREIVLMKIAGTMVAVASDKNHPKCVTAGIFLSKVWGRMRDPEPEWAEKKREADRRGEEDDQGDLVIHARLVLEEEIPKLEGPTLQ